jgi:hypothetical protein
LFSFKQINFYGQLSLLFIAGFAAPVEAQAANYNVSNISPSTVYAGSTAYFQLRVGPKFDIVPTRLHFNSLRLSNATMEFALNCRGKDCLQDTSGRYYYVLYPGPATDVIVRFTVPPGTAPGQYTVAIDTEFAGVNSTISVPLRIQASPASPSEVSSLPDIPIPGLSKWEGRMVTVGKKWCNPTEVFSINYDGAVWFYDGARVYFQMSDYTGDRSWEACALNIARQYRDGVIAANGKLQGWRVFSRGLQMAYERTGDASYRRALALLATNAPFVTWQSSLDDVRMREIAYALNAVVDAARAGEPESRHMTRLADYLLIHYDRLFVAKNYTIHQTFWDGLAAEALINYYELTKDPRVPPTVKLMLDWMWDFGWNKSTFQIVYNPDPIGPKCSSGCLVYHANLINMIVPAFAWYWQLTGDGIYQQRGDEMWVHGLDETVSWGPKIFNQSFRWSPDYVRWRTVSKATSRSALSSIALSPTSVVGGKTTTLNKVSLSGPAPAGGLAVSLSSSDGANASVPAMVQVPEGAASAPFSITTRSVNSTMAARITATSGGVSKSSSLTLNAEAPSNELPVKEEPPQQEPPKETPIGTLTRLIVSPGVVQGGVMLTQNSVTISAPAGPSGAVVHLTSTNAGIATVPAQVVIAAGQTSVTFPVKTTTVTSTATATITASYGGVSQRVSIAVFAKLP